MEVSSGVVQVAYAAATLAGLVIGYVVWTHRETTGALPLLGSIAGAWWWSAGLLLATLTESAALSMWLERSIYAGIVLVPPSVFLFGLVYTGRERLVSSRLLAALSIHPVVVVALAVFNPGDVFFTTLSPDPTTPTGVAIEWGIAFWLHSAYSYVLFLGTAVLIVRMLFRTRSLYRGQILALVLALLSPFVGNLLWVAGPVTFDSTPIGFAVANVFFAVAIVRFRLVELTPIARDRVIDTISDAMFVVDGEDRIVEVNPAGRSLAEGLVGETDLVGRRATELLAPLPDARERYAEIVTGDEERRLDLSLSDRHYEITASPVTDDRGDLHGWLFLVADVTRRVRRERELRRRNEQLDQFASVVSHDLRNPITVAEGYAELARETEDLSHLDEVTDALDRMESIVDDVLTLARDEGDAVEVAEVDLEAVATDAWETVDTGAAELRIEETATVEADRSRLARLLENLFRNAVEHGPDPDASADAESAPSADAESALTVTVGLVEGRDGPIGFSVADDGRGISADVRESLFEMGVTSSPDGTGFGLSIVEQIADVHGWEVRATESDAGGARFELTGVELAVLREPSP